MNAGFGGSIHPSRARKSGWFPKGIIDSSTQKMALSWRRRYSRSGMSSSERPCLAIGKTEGENKETENRIRVTIRDYESGAVPKTSCVNILTCALLNALLKRHFCPKVHY